MNWEALGAIGEIVGAVGVIVSLLHLASQVRRNSRQLRHASAQTVLDKLNGLIGQLARPDLDPEWPHAPSTTWRPRGRWRSSRGPRASWSFYETTSVMIERGARILPATRCLNSLGVGVAVLVSMAACAGSAPPDSDPLSPFRLGEAGSAHVIENVTACTVDAVCSLRLEFSDTVVVAVYGSGERPATGCSVGTNVSDVAFDLKPGDVIEVVLGECDGVGLVPRSIN